MENNKKRIIVVLGMHRSGTSALTRGLKVLGVDLGDNFWPASFDNEKGFWEAPDIVLFNETILRKLNLKQESNHNTIKNDLEEGLRIRSISKSSFGNEYYASYLRSDVFSSERQIAIDILKNKLKEDVVFGFKDPRVSILLPFWQSVFEALDLDDSYIIAVRNPLNIAESLFKRNNISIDVSMLLWYKHIFSSLLYTQDKKNVFVHYDDLLENPKQQLERISKYLFLPIPESSLDDLEEYSNNFLTSSLRHHEYSIHDLENNINVSKSMTELYLLLDQLSKDVLTTDCDLFKEQWKIVEKHNSEYVPLLTIIDRLEKDQYDIVHEKFNLVEERDNLLEERNNLSEEKIDIIKANDILTQERNDFIQKLDILTYEKNKLIIEKESLTQKKDILTAEKINLSQKNDYFIKIIDNVFLEKDTLEKEKDILVEEKINLIHKNDDFIKIIDSVFLEKDILVKAKNILTQEKENIVKEKKDLIQVRDNLLLEKESLIQEKNILILEKESLTQTINAIAKEIKDITNEKDILTQERNILMQERIDFIQELKALTGERDILVEEKIDLAQEKDILTQTRDKLTQERNEFMVEKENLVQVRDTIVHERDELIQKLNNVTKDLNDSIAYAQNLWVINQKITNSISWRMTALFRSFNNSDKISRLNLTPYLSKAIHLFSKKLPLSDKKKRKFKNYIKENLPFFYKKFKSSYEDSNNKDKDENYNENLTSSEDLTLSRFDAEFYLSLYPDVKSSNMDPFQHYLNHGMKEGRLGSPFMVKGFDAKFYLDLYPDLMKIQMNPMEHYLNYGMKEGRIGCLPIVEKKKLDPSKETILIISHDATRTGAPILVWNICLELKDRYNIVLLLLGPGKIQPFFEDVCNVLYGPFGENVKNYYHMKHIVNHICNNYDIKFCIANSIESRSALQPLDENNIPNILMIHEFFADEYYSPDDFLLGLVWSGETIFSAEIVKNSIKNEFSEFHKKFVDSSFLLAQGKSKIPSSSNNVISSKFKLHSLKQKILNNFTKKPFIVLGGGTVQSRKGVDLFFETAAIIKHTSNEPIVFLWFGHECGREYYDSVKKIIKKNDMTDSCYLLDPIENFEDVYEMCDLFFLSSRLDPLPNVVIDAMHSSIPIICFSNTTGVEEVLLKDEKTRGCVLPYLNIKEAAKKILEIYHSKKEYNILSKCVKKLYKSHFNMKNYVKKLLDIVKNDFVYKEIDKNDFETLLNSDDFKVEFYLTSSSSEENKNRAAIIKNYIRYSRKVSDKGCRKITVGFNDYLYTKLHGLKNPKGNSLADYIREGRPQGPWVEKNIDTSSNIEFFNNQLKCALHIHVFYPELLDEIIKRLMMNDIKCDLFISAPSNSIVEKINKSISFYNKGTIVVKSVPNKGRNFGPLFSAFSNDLSSYDIVGHFHTKKSVTLLEKSGDKQTQIMIEKWCTLLLENLIGGINCSAKHIMNAFDKDKKLGLVFPFDPHKVGWTENKPFADELAKSMKISDLPDEINSFPVGSMFWARPEALKPLFDLDLTWDDYPEEPLPYDGSMLHAIERILPIVANHQGYEYALVHTPGVIR